MAYVIAEPVSVRRTPPVWTCALWIASTRGKTSPISSRSPNSTSAQWSALTAAPAFRLPGHGNLRAGRPAGEMGALYPINADWYTKKALIPV